MQQLIPDIGSTGNFKFKEPFDKKIPGDIKYTCQSIRKISELIALNEDVLTINYLNNGLTKEDYERDRELNISIISLQSEIGAWFYVPSTYLSAYPNINGVTYTRMMLGVSLGAIPDSIDLTGLTASITNIIYDQLGISAEIKPIAISQSAIVTYDNHERIEAVRKAKIKTIKSDTQLLAEAVRDRDAAILRATTLENYLKNNIDRFT